MSEYVQQVEYLNTVFAASLDENSPQAPQPQAIIPPLFPHQKACLHQMISKATQPSFLWNNQSVHSKIGILGDQHNSGKTLTTLAFLANDQHTPIFPTTQQLTSSSNPFFFSTQSYQDRHPTKTPINVILVPYHLVHQWKKTIETSTTLRVFTIDSKSNLSGINQVPSNSIFLVNSRLFKHFNTFSTNQNLQYKFFFIDEATFIYLSANDPQIDAAFIWLITSDWIPLLVKQLFNIGAQLNIHSSPINPELREILEIYRMSYQIYGTNSTYIKNYIPFHHDARFSMVVRCSKRFIQQSFIQRPEIYKQIICRPSFNLNSLTNFFNFQGNIDKLDVFLPYIYQDLNIPFYKLTDILHQEFNGASELCLSRLSDDCSICLEIPRQKVLTPCCRRIYCAICILKNYFQSQKCPTCRTGLNINTIKPIEHEGSSINPIIKYRDDSIFQYLSDNSGCTTIVYSTHQNIYYNIKNKLDSIGLTSECLEYSASSNLKKIRNFQDKAYKILFISDILLLNLFGLNFGFVDSVVFVNKIPYLDMRNILLNSTHKGYSKKFPLENSLTIIEINNILE